MFQNSVFTNWAKTLGSTINLKPRLEEQFRRRRQCGNLQFPRDGNGVNLCALELITKEGIRHERETACCIVRGGLVVQRGGSERG